MTMKAKLIMFRQDGSKREFPLPAGSTTVGRKDDCSIRIPLATVSRRHCEIFVEDDGLTLKDLGAANGTFLNNRKITEEELEAGDQIVIGPVVFTVQVNGEPSDDEIIKVRSKVAKPAGKGAARVGTSRNVNISTDESDPISALEALASSADQTAIHPEDED